jgi:hypothetical protein
VGIRESIFLFLYSNSFILMVLQIGPFYFPLIFANLGFVASAGIFSSIIFAFGCLPVVGLHIQGRDRKPVSDVV